MAELLTLFETGVLKGYQAAKKGAAYTKTYNTPGLTVPVMTAAAVATTGAAQPNTNFGWTSAANANQIPVALNALQADALELKKLLGAIIDDLQAFDLVTGVATSPLVASRGGVSKSIAVGLTQFTQTYAVAARTIPAATVAAWTGGVAVVGTTPGFGFTTQAQADAIPVACNAVAADLLALYKVTNGVIDALQAYGLARPFTWVDGRLHRNRGELASLAPLFVQTYATTVFTVPAATAVAVAVTGAATLAAGANWGYGLAAQGDAISGCITALIADTLALKQVITQLVTTLQAYGLAA